MPYPVARRTTKRAISGASQNGRIREYTSFSSHHWNFWAHNNKQVNSTAALLQTRSKTRSHTVSRTWEWTSTWRWTRSATPRTTSMHRHWHIPKSRIQEITNRSRGNSITSSWNQANRPLQSLNHLGHSERLIRSCCNTFRIKGGKITLRISRNRSRQDPHS